MQMPVQQRRDCQTPIPWLLQEIGDAPDAPVDGAMDELKFA
jgi:hypothetical protein